MIDINKTWIPQIIAYAEIVSDHDLIYKCWVSDECDSTSVTSMDELYEQIFDDLDSDNLLESAKRGSAAPSDVLEAITGFLDSIKKLDEDEASDDWSGIPERLLASASWQRVVDSAERLLSVSASTDYKAMR
jgi:hypothetical protein